METGHVQDLFSFDSGHVLPTITKISRVGFVYLTNYRIITSTPNVFVIVIDYLQLLDVIELYTDCKLFFIVCK